MSHTSKYLVTLHMCMFLMRRYQSQTQKLRNVSSLDIPQNKKDIDASILPLKVAKDGEVRNGDVSSNVEQESQLINGPQESSISGSNNTPWKRRLRSLSIVHSSSQTSSRNPHVDDESSDLEKSVGEESRIPLITTPGDWMANKVLKTPNNNNGV